MQFRRTQVIALVLCLSFFLLLPFTPALSQDKIEQTQTEVNTINKEVSEATARYDDILSSIAQTDAEISAKQGEIDSLNSSMEKSSETINRRLAGIYKHGQVSLLDVVLGSRTVADFALRLDILTRITQKDLALKREIGANRASVEQKEKELQARKGEQTQLLSDLAQTKHQIESRLRDKQDTLADLETQQSAKSTNSAPAPSQPSPSPHLTRNAEGIATWYNYTGGYTAAHNTLPLGTKVLVTNLSNGRQVWVEIVDRGIAGSAIIDLEEVAFSAIANTSQGVCYVRLEW